MRDGRIVSAKSIACIFAWLIAPLIAPVASAQGASCDIALSAARIDYGRLSRATLAPGAKGLLELPARSLGIRVRCADPGDMTVFFRGATADGMGFLLGEKGHFRLRARDGRLDGMPVDLGQVDRGPGSPGRSDSSLPWLSEQGLTPLKNGHRATGREFSAQIDILANVDEQALTVADAAQWTTTASVELASTGSARELTLQAEVQPGRCNVEVVRHLSFGRLRLTDLDGHGDSTHVPTTQKGQIKVVCDGPMPFAFRMMRDEREGTAVVPVGTGVTYPDAQLFGLGKTASGENIGAYVLRWETTAMSEQGALHATRSADGGRSWTPAGGTVIADRASTERVGYADLKSVTTGPLAVRTLDVALDADIYIAPTHTLSRNEDIAADGAVTFEIIY
jgi:hypothetical protein